MAEEHQCPKCGKNFSTDELLQEHARIEHSGPVKPLEEGLQVPAQIASLRRFLNMSFFMGLVLGLLISGLALSGFMYWQSLDHRVEVPVTVVTCENCSYGRFINTTDRMFNARYEEVDYQSERGQELIQKYNLNYVPGFIFDDRVEKAEYFARAKPALVEFEDAYVIPDTGLMTAQRLSDGKELR